MDSYAWVYSLVVGLVLLLYPMVALGRIWMYTRKQTELFEAYMRSQIKLLEEIRNGLNADPAPQQK